MVNSYDEDGFSFVRFFVRIFPAYGTTFFLCVCAILLDPLRAAVLQWDQSRLQADLQAPSQAAVCVRACVRKPPFSTFTGCQ